MEYVPLGSLRDYLPKHNVGLAHVLLFAQQICEVTTRGKQGSAWGTGADAVTALGRRGYTMSLLLRSCGGGAGETNVQC